MERERTHWENVSSHLWKTLILENAEIEKPNVFTQLIGGPKMTRLGQFPSCLMAETEHKWITSFMVYFRDGLIRGDVILNTPKTVWLLTESCLAITITRHNLLWDLYITTSTNSYLWMLCRCDFGAGNKDVKFWWKYNKKKKLFEIY